ncbi:MAG: tRNA 2-thiouridine(34) synthase MnmA [Bacteroidetes bacterium]|nr:tRNA 2-thiouridine(34) synthase MnmA [Bacteroidota bacterium]
MKRVVVGLSGGVDSSVAAYLLKEQGYEVIGIFMRNWMDDSVIISEECPWLEDSNDALQVAQKLDIPFHILDLSEAYKERIVDYMFKEYAAGYTPNPDVLCNREVKFDLFLKEAMKLGADYVATGHYCQKEIIEVDGQPMHRLISGADPNKDQSYFLCQVSQEQLSKVLFPIGQLLKPEVRRIAKEQGLVTAEKRDSQGLCFIGKVKLPVFLQQQLEPKTGNIIALEADEAAFHLNGGSSLEELSAPFDWTDMEGQTVGEHQGAHFYTVGQRKGLGLGGFKEPLFILGTDTSSNLIYVGEGESHPGLFRKVIRLRSSEENWIRPDMDIALGEDVEFDVRIRYRQALQKGLLIRTKEGLFIRFEEPQRAVAPGQFAAWYKDGELIGSGVIA